MSKTTDLAIEINKAISDFTDEVKQGIQDEAIRIADESVQKLKETSPKQRTKNGGKYAKGWKKKVTIGESFINVKIFNSNYQLTHLLEYGHAVRGGGRTKAIPHIGPVEKEANEEFESSIKEIIRNGGR